MDRIHHLSPLFLVSCEVVAHDIGVLQTLQAHLGLEKCVGPGRRNANAGGIREQDELHCSVLVKPLMGSRPQRSPDRTPVFKIDEPVEQRPQASGSCTEYSAGDGACQSSVARPIGHMPRRSVVSGVGH